MYASELTTLDSEAELTLKNHKYSDDHLFAFKHITIIIIIVATTSSIYRLADFHFPFTTVDLLSFSVLSSEF